MIGGDRRNAPLGFAGLRRQLLEPPEEGHELTVSRRQSPDFKSIRAIQTPIGQRENRRVITIFELAKHSMNFANTGTATRERVPLQTTDRLEELHFSQGRCAAEPRVPAQADDIRHPANVIVVPMGGNNQIHSVRRAYSDTLEVGQSLRSSTTIDAGIDNDPRSVTEVHDNTLAVPRPEDGNFDFVRTGRAVLDRRCSHRLNAVAILAAHTSAARRSDLATAGRSRNTI